MSTHFTRMAHLLRGRAQAAEIARTQHSAREHGQVRAKNTALKDRRQRAQVTARFRRQIEQGVEAPFCGFASTLQLEPEHDQQAKHHRLQVGLTISRNENRDTRRQRTQVHRAPCRARACAISCASDE